METMCKIYQNFVVELVLLLSFVAHMWSKPCLFAASKRVERNAIKDDDDNDVDTAAIARRGNNSAELRLHRLAGYVLAFFVLCHVFAVRIAVLGGAWEKTLLALAFSWAESPTTNTIQMKGRSKGWS